MELAFCGLECNNCDAFIATKENDDSKRKQVAENWSNMFGADIKPEEINCNGCHSDLLFSHCKVCEIRKCGMEKSLTTCGDCSDYSCDKLNFIHDHDSDAKKRLDIISAG